jgi:16S rRNA C1402 N4-methylase RsmH
MHREISSFVSDYLAHHHSQTASAFQMLDCTFGGGGHSIKLLQENKELRVLGVDLDSRILEQCRERYAELI